MLSRFPGFVGPSYQLRSITLDCQRLINLFPELDELGTGKEAEVGALIGTPGRVLLTTLPTQPYRGSWVGSNNGRVFVVSGNGFYEILNNNGVFSYVNLGSLLTATGSVGISDNGQQLLIVDGANGYVYTFSETVATAIPWQANTAYATGSIIVPVANGPQYIAIVGGNSGATEPDFPTGRFDTIIDGTVTWEVTTTFTSFNSVSNPGFLGSNIVIFQDGYFILAQPGTNVVYVSNLYSIQFNALNFLALSGSPAIVLNMVSLHRNVYIQTTETTEIYYNSGQSPGFPFTRIGGGYFEKGLAAQFSLTKNANAIFWMGQDTQGTGVIYTTSTYIPTRISTFAVETAIASYETISDAIAYAYQDSGHEFYVISFPTAQATWAYDVTTNMWHERAYFNNGQQFMDLSVYHTLGFGMHIVGDSITGNVYQMVQGINQDNGQTIIRKRVAPHLAKDMRRIFHSYFQLDIQQGVGLDGIQQGDNPMVMLRFSNDGARTWSNIKTASYGRIGATKTRCIFRRLGQARDRVYEVTISDPTFVSIVGAELDLEVGVA
jgi:hypothetical protein